MKKTFLFIFVISLVFGVAFVSGCSDTSISGEKIISDIKVGSILILSGDGASWGIAAKNGIDLAISEINTAGGINGAQIVAVHEDNHSDPKQSVSAYQKLTTADDVHFVIGPNWSRSGMVLKDMATSDQTIMISPSLGMGDFNESSEYLFNTWPHDFILSERVADMLYDAGKRNIGIFGAQDVWVKDQTIALKKQFEKRGGVVSYLSEPNLDQKNLQTEVLKVKKKKNLDAMVITSAVYPVGVEFAQTLRELGITIPLYSMTLDKNIIASANGAYDSMKFLTFLTPNDEFSQKYEDTFHIPVEIGADSAYDAMMMLAQAMKLVGTDTTDVANYLNGITEYHGASGILVSDGSGGFTKPFKTYIVENGIPIVSE